MLLIAVGVLLMLAATAALIVLAAPGAIGDPGAFADLRNALFCEPNETYLETPGRYTRNLAGTGGGRSLTAECRGGEGARRDVTGRSFAITAGVFGVPFLSGLLLFLGGLVSFLRRGVLRLPGFSVRAGSPRSWRDL